MDRVEPGPLTEALDLEGVWIERARTVETRNTAGQLRILFEGGGHPLAVSLLDEGRRIVYIGFDLARSSLPRETAFPLLMARSFAWLAPETAPDRPSQQGSGAPLEIPLPAGTVSLTLTDPDGETAPIEIRDGIARLDVPRSDRRSGVIAVNLASTDETDIAPRQAPAEAPPGGARPVTGAARPIPIWPWLALLALALLALEWPIRTGVARRARVRMPAPGPTGGGAPRPPGVPAGSPGTGAGRAARAAVRIRRGGLRRGA